MDPRDKHPRSRHGGPGHGDGSAALRRLPAYVYLADVFRGRHVLEIGCGDGAGAAYLARAGAASVIGVDRLLPEIELARARHRLANLSFAAADYAAIDLDDHTVDVICVPDGGELARWPAFLDEARRVLARDGRLVMTVPSSDRAGAGPGAMSYHDLVGRLAPVFGEVRMIAVTPFVGFALVEYADVDLDEVELETALAAHADRDTVTDYVAVAGATLGAARGYTVVEVPVGDGLEAIARARGVGLADPALEARVAEAEAAAAEAVARLAEAEAAKVERGEEAELRKRLARAVEERSVADAEIQTLRARLGRAEEEVGQVAAQAAAELGEARRSVEEAAAERTAMARAAEQHAAEMRARAAELAERDAYVDELRQELEEVAAAERAAAEAAREGATRGADLEAEARDLRARLAAAEGELLRLRNQPPRPPPARLAELEQALAERTAAADKAAARWKEAEGKTDELWRKIGELQKELAQAREQAVETARQQRQAAQIALTRAVDEASKKLVSAQDQAIRAEKERLELERALVEERARVERLTAEATQAAASLEAARQALEERYGELVAARGELARARAEQAARPAPAAAEPETETVAETETATVAATGTDADVG